MNRDTRNAISVIALLLALGAANKMGLLAVFSDWLKNTAIAAVAPH